MDRFLAPATLRRIEQNSVNQKQPKQLMKFVVPSYEDLISKVRSNEHANLKLTRNGQQHLVPTRHGLLLYIPDIKDKTYVHTEDAKRIMHRDDLAHALNTRDREFGSFSEVQLWKWNEGASQYVTKMLTDILELHDTLTRIFKVTDENRLQVSGQVRTACLTAETTDFLKSCRFIILAQICRFYDKTVIPVPISIFQYALPRTLPADVICRGSYYRDTDAQAWKGASLTDIRTFGKTLDGLEFVSSLRYYLTDDRSELWTGGSVMVTLGVMRARESAWSSKHISFSRTVLPVMEDEDTVEEETDGDIPKDD